MQRGPVLAQQRAWTFGTATPRLVVPTGPSRPYRAVEIRLVRWGNHPRSDKGKSTEQMLIFFLDLISFIISVVAIEM